MESFEEVSSILEHTASDGHLSRGNPVKGRIEQYSSFEWRQAQSDTAMRTNSGGLNLQTAPMRSHPAQPGEGFDAPSTL